MDAHSGCGAEATLTLRRAPGAPPKAGCDRCGKCCREFSIVMPFDRDMWKFYQLHGAMVVKMPPNRMRVDVPCVCYNWSKQGCADYEHRPQICRDFLCDRAKHGNLIKVVK